MEPLRARGVGGPPFAGGKGGESRSELKTGMERSSGDWSPLADCRLEGPGGSTTEALLPPPAGNAAQREDPGSASTNAPGHSELAHPTLCDSRFPTRQKQPLPDAGFSPRQVRGLKSRRSRLLRGRRLFLRLHPHFYDPPTAVPLGYLPPETRGLIPGIGAPRSARPLDVTAVPPIDLRKLRSLAGPGARLHGLLDLLTDGHSFRRKLLGTPLVPGRKSDAFAHHAVTLEGVGFVERVPRSEPLKCVLPAFAVEKGEHHSRAIVDGRPLNELMEPPPKFSLLRVDEVIAKMMSKSHAVVVDLKSYFFQFPVGRSTSAFFGLRTRRPDGGVALYRWRRLTMGWSFSPVIAQDSALVITETAGDDRIVWYDDWALVGDCPDALRAVRDRVLRRARKVCMTVNDEKSVLEPSSTPVVLGVEFDLAAKRYRLKQEWARKAHLLFCSVDSTRMTLRGVWKVVGTAIWAWTVWGTPLCRVSPVLAWMGTLAHQVLTGSLGWESLVRVSDDVFPFLAGVRRRLSGNRWVVFDAKQRDTLVEAWSDASMQGWAWLVGSMAMWGPWRDVPQHIFFAELTAAKFAIAYAASRSPLSTIRIFVDNLPAVNCLRNWKSKTQLGNFILCQVRDVLEEHQCVLETVWVPTAEQLADVWTRDPYRQGIQPPRTPFCVA
ncbi:hypothetical protein DIPPA_06710 [Diplonema papillatum]|nr:hypothetical protein DIPPA_31161 [Diplonema papillatum]KAJ9453711.1 hypothetical protein DIPPA_06710 [Diplonema papillatum]